MAMKGSGNKAAALLIVVALTLSPIAMAGDQWCLRVQNKMSNRTKPILAYCSALWRHGEKIIPVRGEEMKFCLEEPLMKMISCTLYTFHRKKKIDFKPLPDDFKSKCSNGDCIWVAKGRGLFLFNGSANTYEYQAAWDKNDKA